MKKIALFVLAAVALAFAGMMLHNGLQHRTERARALDSSDRSLSEAKAAEAQMKTAPADKADYLQFRFEHSMTDAASSGDEAARVHSASLREFGMSAGGLVLALVLVVFARRQRKAGPAAHAGVAIG